MPSTILNPVNEIEMESLSCHQVQSEHNSEHVIILKDAAFGIKENRAVITHGLNLEVRRSSLTMIIGKVGSGKSTVLKGLIGELPTSTGSIESKFRESSYCEQQPWLFNASIQNNILGYSPLEAKWYETVIKCCALDKDFSAFQFGDLTLVGSKGITLSGGQKARVVRLLILTLFVHS
jgi:ATP-binding cassette subfamily C (CFTR/MRP) protein 1